MDLAKTMLMAAASSSLPPAEFVSFSNNDYTATNRSTVTIQAPAGVVEGDLMLAFITEGNTRDIDVTPPAGWTEIVANESAPSAFVYLKVATSSEPTEYVFGVSLAGRDTGSIIVYRNAEVDVIGTTVIEGTDTVAAPSITITPGASILLAYYMNNEGVTWTTPTGMTSRVYNNVNGVGSLAIFDESAGSGATGTRTSVRSEDRDPAIAGLIEIVNA